MFLFSNLHGAAIDVTRFATAVMGCMQEGMHGFPHPAAGLQTNRIPVENSHFSTFSTAFSTGVFHSPGNENIHFWVYITISTGFDRFSIFPQVVIFTIGVFFVQKIPS